MGPCNQYIHTDVWNNGSLKHCCAECSLTESNTLDTQREKACKLVKAAETDTLILQCGSNAT